MSRFDEMCEMKETLVKWAKSEIERGPENVNTEEMGQVIDMIKDLAVAEEKCIKACYYEAILKEMGHEEKGDRAYMDRMGYDGKKKFMPPKYREDEPMADMYWLDNMRMGYPKSGRSRDSMGRFKSGYDGGMDDRYGRPYNEYKEAKRHYTETKSSADKDEMDRHANEHVMDTIATIREIYKSADPELRTRIKGDLTKLVGEMPN